MWGQSALASPHFKFWGLVPRDLLPWTDGRFKSLDWRRRVVLTDRQVCIVDRQAQHHLRLTAAAAAAAGVLPASAVGRASSYIAIIG